MGSLSRTKSGFMETVEGKKKKTTDNARRHNSDDEADEEAQEESSPAVTGRKMAQQANQSPPQLAAVASSGWAKTQSAGARKPSPGARGKQGDAVVADLDEYSVASEDIDALEFSTGGPDSDSNGSFSFLNDDSVASHKASLKGSSRPVGRSIPPLRAPKGGNMSVGNLSEDSADVEFSVTEQELSTSQFGEGYDYSVKALPPVKGRG